MSRQSISFTTAGGVAITRTSHPRAYADAVSDYIDALDTRRGAVFSSNYEYPGRYTRWDTAIVDPPLGIVGRGRSMRLEAYNSRGRVLLDMLAPIVTGHAHVESFERDGDVLHLTVREPEGVVPEEMRSRVPTVFSILRAITDHMHTDEDGSLAESVLEMHPPQLRYAWQLICSGVSVIPVGAYKIPAVPWQSFQKRLDRHRHKQ